MSAKISKPARSKPSGYGSWAAMRERCLNPKSKCFANYGGRGITICASWRDSFANFASDMGERPDGRSLDRIDNDGNYEPGNCRWATDRQQTNNRRVTILVTLDGATRPLAEWCEDRGLNYQTVWDRIYRRGWAVEEALAV